MSRAGTIRLNSKAQRAARFMMILIAGHHPADKLSVRLPDYKVIDLVFPPIVLSKGYRQPNKPIPTLKKASLLIVNSSTIKIACQFCEIKYYCGWVCIGCGCGACSAHHPKAVCRCCRWFWSVGLLALVPGLLTRRSLQPGCLPRQLLHPPLLKPQRGFLLPLANQSGSM
jgi:hypothetical protein